MSSARLKEMRQKEDKELLLDLGTLRRGLFDLRFQSSTEKLSNPSKISQIKKDVARIKTILRERGLAAQSGAQE